MKNLIGVAFLASILISSRAWSDPVYVIGGEPNQYATPPNQQDLERQLTYFQTNGVTSEAIVKTSADLRKSEVQSTSLQPVLVKDSVARSVESSSATPDVYPCPQGYARYTGTDSPFPPMAGRGICFQETYNASTLAKVVSFLGVNADGSPATYRVQPSSASAWGEIIQKVYYEDGRKETIQNNFYASAGDLAAAKAAIEARGGIVLFSGAAPDARSGYQLQYIAPGLRSGFSYPEIVDAGANLTPEETARLNTWIRQIPAAHRAGLKRIVLRPAKQPGSPTHVFSDDEIVLEVPMLSDRGYAMYELQTGLFNTIGNRYFDSLEKKYKDSFAAFIKGRDETSAGSFYSDWMTRGMESLLLLLESQQYKYVPHALFVASMFYNADTGNTLSYNFNSSIPNVPRRSPMTTEALATVRTEELLTVGKLEFLLANNRIMGWRMAGEASFTELPGLTLPPYLTDTIPKAS